MLRLAIHGRGQWGARLVDSVKQSERVRFVKVITRKDDYAREIADPQIDGVVLATPHSQHVGEIIAAAKARKHALDVDDVTVALLRFASGLTGYLASLYATGDLWRLQVYGTKGWLEMRSETELAARELQNAVETTSFSPIDKERAELEDFAA